MTLHDKSVKFTVEYYIKFNFFQCFIYVMFLHTLRLNYDYFTIDKICVRIFSDFTNVFY